MEGLDNQKQRHCHITPQAIVDRFMDTFSNAVVDDDKKNTNSLHEINKGIVFGL